MGTTSGAIGYDALGAQPLADASVPVAQHPRFYIRQQVVARLSQSATAEDGSVTYATTAGPRVFPTRSNPLLLKDLPAIAVFTDKEPVDRANSNIGSTVPDGFTVVPGHLCRKLQLQIEIVVADAPLDDKLDQIAWQTEAVMEADCTLNGLIASMLLVNTEMEWIPNQQALLGVLRLTYELVYYTVTQAAPDPPAAGAKQLWGGVAPNIGPAHLGDYVKLAGN